MKERRFIGVAVAVPVRQIFTYAVDAEQSVAPGCRVNVRFGAQKKIGLVVSGPDSTPPDGLEPSRIRPVTAVLDDEPLVPPDVLALSEWLIRYYQAVPGGAYLLPLPPQLGGGRRGGLKKLSQREELVARFVRLPDANRGERIGPKMDRALTWLATVDEANASEVREATGCGRPVLRRLEQHGLVSLDSRQVARDPFAEMADDDGTTSAPELTGDQQAAVRAVSSAFGTYQGFLLHGVTGSGKTEVYLQLIGRALERGLGALVLVPEIALTPQLVRRFRGRLGNRIAVLHSGLQPADRHEQWLRIARGELKVVIGARSAVFAPIVKLGLIVVDEEHESSFKQDVSPRYHARDLALVRGYQTSAPVVLGSATPSLESWANVERGKLTRLAMPERATQRPLPEVELVDLRSEPTVDPNRLVSQRLLDAMRDNLAAGHQTIVFLNRRGFAAFTVCRSCGHTLDCPRCAVSLTWHRRRGRLVCHYCDHVSEKPGHCPACHDDALEDFGVGTEQAVSTLESLLPSARIGRMDRDTTRGKGLLRLLEAFRLRRLDILVGTQMLAKGHDFPGVTLVGVLLAEQSLKLPDFRAAERTFQLMTQIAGRAGRAEHSGKVLVQTYLPDHYALTLAQKHDTETFLNSEFQQRRQRAFPPHTHLIVVRVDSPSERDVDRCAGEFAAMLGRARHRLGSSRGQVVVVGPRIAPLERLKDRHRRQILINASERGLAQQMAALFTQELDAMRLPRNLNVGVDVDPLSFL